MLGEIRIWNAGVNKQITYQTKFGWNRTPSQTQREGKGNCTDIALYKLAQIRVMQVENTNILSAHLERCWLDNNYSKPHMVCIVEVKHRRWFKKVVSEFVLDNRYDDVETRDWHNYEWVSTNSNQWTYKEALEEIDKRHD